MSIVVNSVEEVVDIVREQAAKINDLEKAAKAVKDAVMNTKRNEVNATYRHEIIFAFVCSFVEAAKEAYPGAIIMTVPNPIWIPGSCALGAAIGLMEEFLAINEVPIYEIEFQNPEAYEYNEEDEDAEWVKECKQDAKNSINLWRLLRVRFLVAAIMKTFNKEWNY